jgi:hypothetical protein
MLTKSTIVRTKFFRAGRIMEIIDGTVNGWTSPVYFRVNIHEPKVRRKDHIISLEEIREVITEEAYQASRVYVDGQDVD